MDLAGELVELLKKEGLAVKLNWTWSGFPTVTATCKPLVSPVASMLFGPPSTSDVLPQSPEAKPATKPVLFKLMKSEGWETDSQLLPDGKLWAETAASMRRVMHSVPAWPSVCRQGSETRLIACFS